MVFPRIAAVPLLAVSLAVAVWPAAASDASVKITSPTDGARIDRVELIKLVFETDPGPNGDHVHIYADGKEVGIVRELEGSFTFGELRPGPHTLCVKLADKAYMPVGAEQCIKVRVQ